MFADYSPSEDLGKTEKEFYPEYEFVETAEENSAPSPNIVNTSESISKIYIENAVLDLFASK